MKVVIAGGSGLIGSALTRAVLDRGHEAVVLTRDPSRAVPPGARAVAWHPPTLGPWTAELDGAGAVVNLAGASIGRWPWTARRKRLLRESRLVPTRTLVEAMATLPAAARPGTLLNASGTDVYEGRDAEPATESTPPARSFLGDLCLDWEAEALRAAPLGVRVVLLRTSSVIAPGAAYLRVVTRPFRLFVGGPLGPGTQWTSWIDLADAVGLYLFALASPEVAGRLNVAAPDPRRQADYARAIGAALGRPSRFRTPAWVLRLLLRDQATLALGSRRVWPARAMAMGYRFRRPVLEDALAAALEPG